MSVQFLTSLRFISYLLTAMSCTERWKIEMYPPVYRHVPM